MLGGLISEDTTGGAAGVPFLKDIPLLGGLFSKQTTSGKRRELIVLITPYVINNSQDAESITEAFRARLGSWSGETPVKSSKPPVVAPAISVVPQ
jgi:general secretion pathway protein D